MSADAELHRTIGSLEARVGHLERELTALRTQSAQMLEILQSAKGGWRALVIVGSISAAAGGILVKALSLIPGLSK